MSEITVSDADARHRFEAHRDGALVGWIEYTKAGRRIVLTHTEVPRGYEGSGVGTALVRGALDAIAAEEPEPQEVVPVCPFVAQWLHRHRQYAWLVTPALRGQFEPR